MPISHAGMLWTLVIYANVFLFSAHLKGAHIKLMICCSSIILRLFSNIFNGGRTDISFIWIPHVLLHTATLVRYQCIAAIRRWRYLFSSFNDDTSILHNINTAFSTHFTWKKYSEQTMGQGLHFHWGPSIINHHWIQPSPDGCCHFEVLHVWIVLCNRMTSWCNNSSYAGLCLDDIAQSLERSSGLGTSVQRPWPPFRGRE